MRIEQGTVALAATHTQTATLEATRSVTAWRGDSRIQLDEAVRITLSGSSAATSLHAMAARMAPNVDGLAGGSGVRPPGLARSGATPTAFGGVSAVQVAGVAGRGPAAGGPGRALAAGGATGADAAGATGAVTGDPAIDANAGAWLLLLRLTGDEAAAARLAKLLGAYARLTGGDEELAARMDALATAHGLGTRSPAPIAPTLELPTLPPGATSGMGRSATAPIGTGPVATTQGPPAPAAPAPGGGWGYREDARVSVTEREAVTFAASASVTTADGRRIDVAAAFAMVRETVMTWDRSVRAGAAARDPLAFALEGGAPRLATDGSRGAVDIDADGTAETVAGLARGTAYLVRDLNGNGLVDDGTELFGPATNDGYAELAALDGDRNGWVDEADGAWARLGLWSGVAGAGITSLGAAGIGAIATASVATPYSYGTGGSLAAAGIFLYEDGRAGISGELLLRA